MSGAARAQAPTGTATLAQPNDSRQLDGCAGCASFTTAYSTPAFIFNGSPVSTTLRYSSEHANPTAYIEVDAKFTSATKPTRIRIRVWNGTSYFTLTNAANKAFLLGDTTSIRLAAQYTAPDTATGVYSRTVLVTAFWGDSSAPTDSLTKTITGVRVLVQNEKNSPYGRGWTVADDARIHVQPDSGLLLTDGLGGLAYFGRVGCSGSPVTCSYTSPTGDYTTLVRTITGGAAVYARTGRAGDVSTWTDGLLTSTTDRWGNKFEIERMSTGDTKRVYRTKLTTVVGSTTISKYTTFAYDGNGKLASITLPDGRQSAFTVGTGTGGLLTAVTDPDGRRALSVSYTSGAIAALSGRDTATTNVIYDNYGQVSKLISPSMVIDSGTTVRDTTVIWSQRRLLLEYQAQESWAVASPADIRDSTFLRVTDARGSTATTWGAISGAASRVVSRSATGATEQSIYTYDVAYRLTDMVIADKQTQYTWNGPLVTTAVNVNPNLGFNDTTTYAYTNSYDQVDSVLVNGTTRARYFYSGSNLAPDSVKADSSVVTRFTYAAAGRVLTVTDRGGNRTVTTSYETTHANPSSVSRTATNVTTATTSYTHDGSGRVVSTTDPVSRVFATKYDSLNRVVRTIGPIGDTTRFITRDSTHTDTLFDAKGQRYVTVRNARGLVTQQVDPRGKSDYYWYDRLGRMVKAQNRRGDTIRVEYDGFGRITRRRAWTVATGQLDTARFTFDTIYAGSVMGANAESVDHLIYLPEGRLTSHVSRRGIRGFSIGYGYIDGTWTTARFVQGDSSGVVQWADTSVTAQTVYHRTRAITDFAGKDAELGIDQYGRHASTVLPTHTTPANKVKEAKGFSWADEPTSQSYTGTNIGTTQNRTYSGYDALGRLGMFLRSATLNPRRSHSYDTGGRLSDYVDWKDTLVVVGWDYVWDELHQEWDSIPAWDYTGTTVRNETYTYDKLANRTDHSASLDSANRLLAFDGWTITYDDAGFMSKRKKGADSLVYSWNALGQLTQVIAPGYTTTYGYDTFGNRVRKTVNGSATRYLVEGDEVIVELDNAWQVAAKYAYYPGIDRPSSMVRAGKRYYYLQDVQGNVVAVTDSAGTIKNTYEYTPYGEAIATTETVANPFRYKGRDWDAEARLYFMRARYYDPMLGRFSSDDPIGLAGGINQTSFVGSEPVNRADPSGLMWCEPWVLWNPKTGEIHDRWMECDYDDQGGGGGRDGGGESAGDPCRSDPRSEACRQHQQIFEQLRKLAMSYCSAAKRLDLTLYSGIVAEVALGYGLGAAAGVYASPAEVGIYARASWHVGLDGSMGREGGAVVGGLRGLAVGVGGGAAVSGSLSVGVYPTVSVGAAGQWGVSIPSLTGFVSYTHTFPIGSCN